MPPADLTNLLDALDEAPGDPAEADRLITELRDHAGVGELTGHDALRAARHLSGSGVGPDLMPAAELAMRAHNEGIDGAGLVFAEAADRIAVLSGRPQPFGTVAVHQNGEVSQAPVDRGVTDDQRAEFGVAPLAELTERIMAQTRDEARGLAEVEGLPPGTPFARVWRDPDPAELRSRWESEGVSCWADGDELTIIGDEPFVSTPVFGLTSWDAGGGLSVLTVRVERLSEAVITYTRHPTGGSAAFSFRRGSHDGRFRGPDAPSELASNEQLKGALFDHTLESDALGEPRQVSVYRPPASAVRELPEGGLPVVYATDGNMFAAYARRLDAAIEAGWCPPVIVVAAHSARADASTNLRAMEYLPGFDDRRFDAHQRFFVDELTAFAEAELPVRRDRGGRAVFGCSDGGGHALATGMLHHDRFGQVLAYSTGMAPDGATRWVVDEGPFVHLCAGTLEGPFHQATAMWAFYFERIGAPHHFTERVAGHDLIQWAEELPVALGRAFPAS